MSAPAKKAASRPKRMGRPPKPGGRDPVVTGRVSSRVIEAMEAWAEKNGLTKSAAMAKLIEAGLRSLGRK